MLPWPSRSALTPPVALALVAACALSACSMFRGGGTPDNEPTLKTLANRKVTVDKEDVVAVNETKAIDAYRKFLDIAPAGAAALGGDAPPRRPRDGQRRQPEPGRERRGLGRARLQGRGQALPGVPEDLSRRPEQRPRPLPDGARLRAERRPRVGAEDARPAGQGLPGDALQQRDPVPARRAAVHGQELRRRREGVRDRARRHRREPVPRPLALHAGLVAVQAGPSRGRPEVVLRRARPEGRRPRRRPRARLDPGPDARRPRAGRGHVPRRQHQPGQPAGRGVDPAVHGHAGQEDLRIPRLRAARRPLHQAGASQGRGRHLQPVRAQEPAARAGAGDAGAGDPDLRADRLHQPGDRGAQGIHRALRPHAASSGASTPTAGTRRSRWSSSG